MKGKIINEISCESPDDQMKKFEYVRETCESQIVTDANCLMRKVGYIFHAACFLLICFNWLFIAQSIRGKATGRPCNHLSDSNFTADIVSIIVNFALSVYIICKCCRTLHKKETRRQNSYIPSQWANIMS